MKRLFAVLAILLLAAACGREETEPFPDDAIGSTLGSVTAGSTVRLANGDTVRISEATLEFYRGRDWQAAWMGSKGPLGQGISVHEAIGAARDDGLPPARYRHEVITSLLAGLADQGDARLSNAEAAQYRADLDILLTEGFNRLARDLVLGMIDPEQAGLDQRIEQAEPPDGTLLNRVVAGQPPSELIAALRPSLPQYERMRTALAAFREVESRGEWIPIEADTTLREGMRDPSVTRLRARLVAGVDREEAALARAGALDPSLFDADLFLAVQRFQIRHALEPDGVVGATTARELNHTVAEWIAELQLNLDRWRWLPRELGERYVLVNIAGFELEVVDGGRVIEAMNVVVGAELTETPIFADSIRYVVVNPYWNVPDGIMERTIGPAMAGNPNYLVDNDMEIVDGRVRQRPGPRNSLGRYKFIFPNEFAVYLHDTPDGHLFDRTERAFSAGCVRIERPRDFARMLLHLQSSQDPDMLDRILATGAEQWIALDRPLPVFLLYFTAWAQEDGSVRFHHDIYGHDEAMGDQTVKMASPGP
jgi:L,D-transpeptidase YcbB